MRKKLKNIGRFIPIFGVIVDTNDENDIKYFNSVGFRGGLYIMYHFYSGLILYGGIYVLLRYVIF